MGGNRSHYVQVVICEYPYVIRKHLIPPFGDLPLSEVTEGRVKESDFSTKIPSLLRGLNATRTYFQTTGKAFFEHNHEYFPRFIRKKGQWRVINGPEGAPTPKSPKYLPTESQEQLDRPTILIDILPR